MALVNYATREINAKIVYYGPGLSGKTTNIQRVFSKVKPGNKGKLISLSTQGDRTLFFDFLPVELGQIRGFKTRFHLYTVPGQVFYNSTRKLVLKGADGVVFVADSQKMMMDENLQSMENLKANLSDMGIKFENFPIVIQYNKRDLPNAAPVGEMDRYLNPTGMPHFEASAVKGEGVLKTLTAIVKFILHDLKDAPDGRGLDFESLEEKGPAKAKAPSAGVPEPAALRVGMPQPAAAPVDRTAVPPKTYVGASSTFESAMDNAPALSFDALEDASSQKILREADPPPIDPELLDAFGVAGSVPKAEEDVYEAVEVPDELGETIAPVEYPWESAPAAGGGAGGAITPEEMAEFSEASGTASYYEKIMAETPPIDAAASIQNFLSAEPQDSAKVSQVKDTPYSPGLEKGPAASVPGKTPPEKSALKPAAEAPSPSSPVEKPAAGTPVNASPEKPASKPVTPVRAAAGAEPTKTAHAFVLPVRITTNDGAVKEVDLRVSVDFELLSGAVDSVKTVEVLPPKPKEPPSTSSRPAEGPKLKPPERPERPRPTQPPLPKPKAQKKVGVFQKILGMKL